jgi:hypothetical protein
MVSPAHARVDSTRAKPIAANIMCGNALSVTIQSPHSQLCTRLRTSKRTTHGELGGELGQYHSSEGSPSRRNS